MEIAKITIIALIATMFTASSFAQEVIRGTVIDKDTKKPIEFVDVYDSTDLVITNSEGKFIFVTSADSIHLKLVGYQTLVLSTEEAKSRKVFYLDNQTYVLNEVVVGANNRDNLNIIIKALKSNYPVENYKEKFYLRNVLKKNDTIIRIQDMDGIIEREGLFGSQNKPDLKPKKKYSVYLNNMRKAGYNEGGVNYRFFDFERILEEMISQFVYPKYFDLEETTMRDTTLVKIEFSPKSTKETKANGYYIINVTDSALLQTYYLDTARGSYTEKSNIKFRDSSFEVLVSYYKNPILNKYLISSAKITTATEVVNEYNNRNTYEATYILKSSLYESEQNLKGKIPISKEVFKLKKDYDPTYWENHNILQLTDEMVEFLERLGSLDSKEFKVTSNIK